MLSIVCENFAEELVHRTPFPYLVGELWSPHQYTWNLISLQTIPLGNRQCGGYFWSNTVKNTLQLVNKLFSRNYDYQPLTRI